jgi:hypothetical protein
MNNITRPFKETFIFDNINELSILDRKEVLQMIYNSQFRSKIKEKGNGVQIKLDDLSESIIDKIFTYVSQKSNEQFMDIAC